MTDVALMMMTAHKGISQRTDLTYQFSNWLLV